MKSFFNSRKLFFPQTTGRAKKTSFPCWARTARSQDTVLHVSLVQPLFPSWNWSRRDMSPIKTPPSAFNSPGNNSEAVREETTTAESARSTQCPGGLGERGQHKHCCELLWEGTGKTQKLHSTANSPARQENPMRGTTWELGCSQNPRMGHS